MESAVVRIYAALLLWANQGLKLANPAFVFVLTLALILVGLEMAHHGFKRRILWQTRLSLVLTGWATTWSALACEVFRNGSSAAFPRDAAFLTYFFAFTGLLGVACLGAQTALHLRLQRHLAPQLEAQPGIGARVGHP